jgi:hypothetical protein
VEPRNATAAVIEAGDDIGSAAIAGLFKLTNELHHDEERMRVVVEGLVQL